MQGGRLAILLLLGLAFASLVVEAQLPVINVDSPCMQRPLTPINGETTDRGTYWAYYDDPLTAELPVIGKVQRLAQKLVVDNEDWHINSFTVAVSGVEGQTGSRISNGFFDFLQPSLLNANLPDPLAFGTFRKFSSNCVGGGLYWTGVAFTQYPNNDPYIYKCDLVSEIVLPAGSTLFFSLVVGDNTQPYRLLAFSTPNTPMNTLAAYRGLLMSLSLDVVKRPFTTSGIPAPLATWTTETNLGFDQSRKQLCIGFQGVHGNGDGSTGGPCKREEEAFEKRYEELLQLQRERENLHREHCANSAPIVPAVVAFCVALAINAVVCIVFCRSPPKRQLL